MCRGVANVVPLLLACSAGAIRISSVRTCAPKATFRFIRTSEVSLRIPREAGGPADGVRALLAAAAVALRTTVDARPLAAAITAFSLGCVLGSAVGPKAHIALAKYNTAEDIPIALIRDHKTITARVVSISDGDSYRVVHLPPLAELRKDPKTTIKAEGGTAKLSDSTLSIRIAAVDCPEVPHFGSKGQPYGKEAKEFAKNELLGQRVQIKLLARDQYKRAVATVSYKKGFFGKKDISEELLKQGLATVYRQGGAEYDGTIDRWEKLEAKAKSSKTGMWVSGKAVDPAAYKKALRDAS